MLFKFATLIGFLVVEPFSKIWGIQRFEIAETERGPVLMAKVYTLVLSVMLYVGLLLGVEIPIILKILTPEEFWLSGVVVGLAVFSRIILASYYHFFFGLLYAKKTHTISIIQIVTSVVNLLMAFLLIKPFGILGAVLVSCLSNTFQCVFAYKMATPYFKIPFEWKQLAVIVVFAGVLFLLVDQIVLSGDNAISYWLTEVIAKPLDAVMSFLHLDMIEGGELAKYALSNIPLLVEGVVRFIVVSLVFIGGLVVGDIFPRNKFIAIFRERSLKPIFS